MKPRRRKNWHSAKKAVNTSLGRDELVKDIEGLEVSELPDKGRDKPDPNRELRRLPPRQTGETSTGDAGLRADDQLGAANRRGTGGRSRGAGGARGG